MNNLIKVLYGLFFFGNSAGRGLAIFVGVIYCVVVLAFALPVPGSPAGKFLMITFLLAPAWVPVLMSMLIGRRS